MIDANLQAFLDADVALTAIVGDRIYPRNGMPSKPTYDLVTFEAESHDLPNKFSGNSGFTQSDYLVDAWSESYSSANTLSDAIRTALKNVTGSFGGINVMQVHITTGPIPTFEDSVKAYRVTQIFSIWHSEG